MIRSETSHHKPQEAPDNPYKLARRSKVAGLVTGALGLPAMLAGLPAEAQAGIRASQAPEAPPAHQYVAELSQRLGGIESKLKTLKGAIHRGTTILVFAPDKNPKVIDEVAVGFQPDGKTYTIFLVKASAGPKKDGPITGMQPGGETMFATSPAKGSNINTVVVEKGKDARSPAGNYGVSTDPNAFKQPVTTYAENPAAVQKVIDGFFSDIDTAIENHFTDPAKALAAFERAHYGGR